MNRFTAALEPHPTAGRLIPLRPPSDDAGASAQRPGAQRPGRLSDGELRRLATGAAAGDQASWEQLVHRLSPLVRGVARGYRLAPVDVDDVCQATWCRLVEHIASLRSAERLPAWLATTARRESLRTLQRAQRQIPYGDDLPEPHDVGSLDEDMLRRERDTQLWTALGRLRSSDQALLRMLVAADGLGEEQSYREVAQSLGVAVGSVGPTRGRALRRLCDALSDPDALRPLAA